MGFFKKIDSVFSSSKDFNLFERTEVDKEIEENIKKVGIDKFGESIASLLRSDIHFIKREYVKSALYGLNYFTSKIKNKWLSFHLKRYKVDCLTINNNNNTRDEV